MTFKRVGTRIYAENGALVRRFDSTHLPANDLAHDWIADLHDRVRRAQRFTAALNGVGPRAENARRSIGL